MLKEETLSLFGEPVKDINGEAMFYEVTRETLIHLIMSKYRLKKQVEFLKNHTQELRSNDNERGNE